MSPDPRSWGARCSAFPGSTIAAPVAAGAFVHSSLSANSPGAFGFRGLFPPHQTAAEALRPSGLAAHQVCSSRCTTAPVIPAGAGSSENGDTMKISTMAIAAVFLVTSQVGAAPVKLGDGALDLVTAGAKQAAVVKGVKAPAKCQCGPGAIYQSKGKK